MVRQRAKERACDNAIKRTLVYRSVFNSGLSLTQLYTYLITKSTYDHDFFQKSLNRLLKNKTVRKKKGKYHISSIKPYSWDYRYKTTQEILNRNKYVFKTLQKIPWIKCINITGSVAAFNADKEADIDIFIITQKKRLWISRLFVVFILKVLNKYPTKDTNREKVCPNILVDERNLTWPKEKQNIYIANEIAIMQPIYDKDDTYFKFLKANRWVFRHFNNFYAVLPEKFSKPKKSSPLLDRIENKLRNIQLSHMEKKKTNEVTKKGFIHFNVKDSTHNTLKEYKDALKKAGLKR